VSFFFSRGVSKHGLASLTLRQQKMPSGFDHVNTNSHDIDGAISIGLGTAGHHTTVDAGVAIGQRVLGSDSPTTKLPLESSVLIGSDIFPAATTSNSIEDSVVIGSRIGNDGAVPGVRNVLIGSDTVSKFNQATDCVIVGESAGNSADILSGTTIIGGSAGRKHKNNDNTHTVGGGSIVLGRNCARNESSNNVTRTIGTDSILVGCGSFATSDANPPTRSLCLGKGSMSLLQNNTTGQICVGGANYNTCLIDTDTRCTIRTDSLDNLRTSSTSTILSAAGTADTHVITQMVGIARCDFTRIGYKLSGVSLLTNRYITDHDGKSIAGIGNSYWVSGASNIPSPNEVRRITITPNMVVPEDDTTSKSLVSVGGTAPTGDNEAPSNVTASDARNIGAARVGGSANMLVYLPRPCQGWRVTSLYLSVYDRGTLSALSSDIEVFSRNYDTTPSASPSVSDHLTIHVDIDLGKKTNTIVPLTVPYTPANGDYLVAYLSAADNDICLVGGYIDIERS